jgi:hypothetical protein
MGFDTEEPAQAPFAAEEGVHLETFFHGAGLEAVEILLAQDGELVPILAVDEHVLGIETGFEREVPGVGIARDRARRLGRLERIDEVGFEWR